MKIVMNNPPEYLMRRMRQRLDLPPNDTSKDQTIKSWTPEEQLRNCVGWELGDSDWADIIIEWARELGVKI